MNWKTNKEIPEDRVIVFFTKETAGFGYCMNHYINGLQVQEYYPDGSSDDTPWSNVEKWMYKDEALKILKEME